MWPWQVTFSEVWNPPFYLLNNFSKFVVLSGQLFCGTLKYMFTTSLQLEFNKSSFGSLCSGVLNAVCLCVACLLLSWCCILVRSYSCKVLDLVELPIFCFVSYRSHFVFWQCSRGSLVIWIWYWHSFDSSQLVIMNATSMSDCTFLQEASA